jgi:hypothetical protein
LAPEIHHVVRMEIFDVGQNEQVSLGSEKCERRIKYQCERPGQFCAAQLCIDTMYPLMCALNRLICDLERAFCHSLRESSKSHKAESISPRE